MALPDNLIAGTLVFLVLGVLLCSGAACMRSAGTMSSMNCTTFAVFVTLSAATMWLTWVCILLHQWHPLISPQIVSE